MQEITSTTNATSVTPYTGKESAPAGFRVINLHWKERKATATEPAVAKRDSRSLIAPHISVVVEPESLQIALQDAVNDLQKSLARSLIEASYDTIKTISFSDLDAAALSTFAAQVATSKRLNTAAIVEWFDKTSGLQESIMAAITVALNVSDPTDLDITKIAKGTQNYRGLFAELAAPRPDVNAVQAEKLLVWAKKSKETESAVYQSVISKLNLLTKRTEVEMLI